MADGAWGGLTDIKPVRVKIAFRLGTSLCQVGFHVRRTGPSFADLQAIADDVADKMVPSLRNLLCANDEVLSVDAVDMVSADGATHVLTGITGIAGQAGDAGPSFITVPLVMKSQLRRRYGQGRILLPIRAEADITGEVLSGQGVTRTNAFATALTTNYMQPDLTSSLHLINVHGALAADRPHKGATPLPAVAAHWYDVTSVRVNPNVGALRSRKQGIGS